MAVERRCGWLRRITIAGTEGGGCRWFVLLFCLTSIVSYGVALLPVSSDAEDDWLWLLSLMDLLWR